LAFESLFQLFRIGGSVNAIEIPLFEIGDHHSFAAKKSGKRTVSGGQFNWGS
jgi:hypothetical protein